MPSPEPVPDPPSESTATDQPTATPPPHQTPTPAPLPPSAITPLDGGEDLRAQYPRTAEQVLSLPWIADGLTDAETGAAQELVNLAHADQATVGITMDRQWIQDDVNALEYDILALLHRTALFVRSSAPHLAGAPILSQADQHDLPPLRAIARLAWSDPAAGKAAATASIPAGVNEADWAALLTVYPSTHRHNPHLAAAMLDYQDVAMSVQTADLLLSGKVTITVIRSGPAGNATPGNIIQALQNVEVLMGLPLPTDNIVLLFASALPEDLELQHHGTHVILRPGYDADETPETGAASQSRPHRATRVLAQVIASYYWQGNAPWLDQGARRLAAAISENARDPAQPVIADTMPCPQARHLAALDNDNPAPGAPDYRCHAAFGERLFLSLYRQEPYLDFLHRFRNLYRIRMDDGADQPRSLGRRDLEFAFGSNPLAGEVIAAWHDGPAPSGIRPADTSRADLRLPGIRGYLSSVLTPDDEHRFQGTFVTNRQEGPPLAEIERADLYGRPLLHITYRCRSR